MCKTLLLLLCACSAGVVVSAPANDAPRYELDSIFAPLADARSPGLAVLVRKNGHTIFRRGYGVRDLRTFAKIDAKTNFRLASCTKQFTAAATMLLVRDGRLRYEDHLTDVFPEFPAYGRAITIRHLLNHTSGLPDYETLIGLAEKTKGPIWTATRQVRDEEVLDLLKSQNMGKFDPGAKWAYSNSGYAVLGLVVAKVSGLPFEQFLHDRIFKPLHMSDTLAYVSGKNRVPNRAYGHTKQGDKFGETDQSPTSAILGDGGVYSNLADLAKWDEALQKHALLNEEEMRAAATPAKPGQDNPYGFGWFLDPYKGRERMWHGGGTMGFLTAVERFTGERLTVIVLCNRTDLDPIGLAQKAADVFARDKNR